jgi:hypothetical protein
MLRRMGPADREPRHIHDVVTIVAEKLDRTPLRRACSYRGPGGGWGSAAACCATLCPIIYNALESYKQVTGYNSHSDHVSGPVRNSSKKGKETTL